MSLIFKALTFFGFPILMICGVIVTVNMILSVDDLKNCPQLNSQVVQCQTADAIVAISGGDTDARVREAIALYDKKWAPVVIFSGAAEDKNSISNAKAMALQAKAAGIPESAIITDEHALNTVGNAAGVKLIVDKNDFKRLILVTSPYHQRRAGLEFVRVLGPAVTIVNHPTASDKYWSPGMWWLNPYSWYLGVGELGKLIFINATGK